MPDKRTLEEKIKAEIECVLVDHIHMDEVLESAVNELFEGIVDTVYAHYFLTDKEV